MKERMTIVRERALEKQILTALSRNYTLLVISASVR